MYQEDTQSAIEAFTTAQWLAFAPLAFQATVTMRDKGILDMLSQSRSKNGCSIDEIASATGITRYATKVLLEAGLGLKIVLLRDGHYFLSKLGHILISDEMTRINFDFTRDVCYQAAAHLSTSLSEGYPAGLKEIGPWSTIYEGLSIMPEPALSSWYAFDHFYSDKAFAAILAILESKGIDTMLDIGCNTGRWAEMCLNRFPAMEVGLVDLPLQLANARERIRERHAAPRAKFYALDMLDPKTTLPHGYELLHMSQFLDCFSEDEIVQILKKARAALSENGTLWIVELFWDRQRFEAAALSLQQTSLYFSCVANGNSKMYQSADFFPLVTKAGFEIKKISDHVGGFHTLIECSPMAAS